MMICQSVFWADLARYHLVWPSDISQFNITGAPAWIISDFWNSLHFRKRPFLLGQWPFAWFGNVEGFTRNLWLFFHSCLLSKRDKMPENWPQENNYPVKMALTLLFPPSCGKIVDFIFILLISDRKTRAAFLSLVYSVLITYGFTLFQDYRTSLFLILLLSLQEEHCLHKTILPLALMWMSKPGNHLLSLKVLVYHSRHRSDIIRAIQLHYIIADSY